MSIRCIKDENHVDELLKNLDMLQNMKIQVGIMSEAGEDMLTIARVHEFGCTIEVTDKMRRYLHGIGIHLKKDTKVINIPERSFIRAGFDDSSDKIESGTSAMIRHLLRGETDMDGFINFIGPYVTGLIEQYFRDLSTPPLHPVTIKRKKSSNPLEDTGHLRNTITYKIVRS